MLFPVVAIASSAGGLEAVLELLGALPAKNGMAYIVVQHLDPDHESLLTEILAKKTRMAVRQATDGVRIEPDNVYVIPPNAALNPVNVLQSREIELVGAFRAHDEFRLAVHLIVSGAIDVSPILSGTYPLSEAATALELAGDRSKVVKLHLAMNP